MTTTESALNTDRMLAHLLLPVLPHTSTEKDLPVLQCVHFERVDGVLSVVATDRYSMICSSIPDPGPDVTLDVHIDAFAALAQVLRAAARRKAPKPGSFSLTADGLTVHTDGASYGFTQARDDHGPIVYLKWRPVLQGGLDTPASKELVGVSLLLAKFALIDDNEMVRVRMSKDNRPMVITPYQPDRRYPLTYTGLLMPVRTES